jgi:hypothetical protein
MKSSSRTDLLLTIGFAILALSPLCFAQAEPASLDSTIEIIRAGTQAERVSIITAAMKFSQTEGAAFWPIYRKYEHERSTLDDHRVAVIKDYAGKYPSLTDSDAKSMAETMFVCDARLAALKRKYYKKFNAVLPAFTVTKFFQLEHRIDLAMDMKVEASLPPLVDSQQNEQEK